MVAGRVGIVPGSLGLWIGPEHSTEPRSVMRNSALRIISCGKTFARQIGIDSLNPEQTKE